MKRLKKGVYACEGKSELKIVGYRESTDYPYLCETPSGCTTDFSEEEILPRKWIAKDWDIES